MDLTQITQILYINNMNKKIGNIVQRLAEARSKK